ncbi:cyclin-C isoform X1 [Saccopteryx bilineata]|uniref:cyclin-C isoform X1 n=3 Tax=Saccopteryx TaxID=59481 RepID=UPI00338F1F65
MAGRPGTFILRNRYTQESVAGRRQKEKGAILFLLPSPPRSGPSRSNRRARLPGGLGLWSLREPLRRLVLFYQGKLYFMAGNFWQSSHYLQWILDKQDLLKERQKDLKFLSEEEYWKLQIFFTNVIQALGEHLKLRQQVIATATVYFKRFYARYSLKSIDPVLMAPTCVFLASKVEEFGVVSNTRLSAAATSVLKTRFSYAFPKEFPYRMNHILECEFYLLELMDCCLIVYHPYRPLLQYVQDMGQEDMLLPLAWRIVNDTYRTDLCLLYPPFMIALACLHVACVVQQKDARQWFAELSVDMEKILEIIRVILKLYEQWKNFDERKEMATILSKMPKPKPPPNSEGEQGPNGSQNSSYSQS